MGKRALLGDLAAHPQYLGKTIEARQLPTDGQPLVFPKVRSDRGLACRTGLARTTPRVALRGVNRTYVEANKYGTTSGSGLVVKRLRDSHSCMNHTGRVEQPSNVPSENPPQKGQQHIFAFTSQHSPKVLVSSPN